MHSRNGPHICPQLNECQGRFRWGAESLVGSLVSVLSSRSSSHTFVVFIVNQKAIDTSWAEGTLVRLFYAVSQAACGDFCPIFLPGTQSQVLFGTSLLAPWTDSGIAEGRALSPLLFNLLVNGPAAVVRRAAPGVQFGSSHRFTAQLHADDL